MPVNRVVKCRYCAVSHIAEVYAVLYNIVLFVYKIRKIFVYVDSQVEIPKLGVDLLTIAAHKMYAPKNAGTL